MTSKVKGQDHDVTWCVWQSRTKSPRNTEIDGKVAYPTGNIAHLFQGQKVKGQGQLGRPKVYNIYELQNWYADGVCYFSCHGQL